MTVMARLAALVTTAGALVSRADCVFATHTCRATNLLSYFTIQSNIAFVILTTLLLVRTISVRTSRGYGEPPWLTTIRAVVTSYLVISGVTFAILIQTAGLTEFTFLVPMSSKLLHFVVPVYAVLDFLFLPGRRRLRPRAALWALAYPLVYAIVTTVRGQALSWYPYVFFDPEWVGSFTGVLAYAAVLGAALVGVTALLALATRLPEASRMIPHPGGRGSRSS